MHTVIEEEHTTGEMAAPKPSILERPMMEFRPFGVDAEGQKICDITGVIVQSNVEYLYDSVSQQSGTAAAEDAVQALCRALNARIRDPAYHVTPAFLRNAWNSYSYEFGCYLRELCEQLSGDPEFHFKAGRARKVPPIIQILLRPFSTPQTYKMWAYVGSKYTKGVLEFGVGKVTNRSAVIWMKFTDKALRQFGPYRDRCIEVICQSCKGGVSGAQLQVHGLAPASVRDLRCAAHGDDCCEWEFTWTPQMRLETSWLWWGAISAATWAALRWRLPEMSLAASLSLAFLPTTGIWLIMFRRLQAQTKRLQSLVREQEQAVDARHEELRESYLEQQRIAVELRRRVNHLTTLHRAGLLLSATFDRETLLQNVLKIVVDDLQYDRAMVAFYDPLRRVAYGARLVGVPEDVAAFAETLEVPVSDPASVEGTVLLRGEPVLVHDVRQSAGRMHPAYSELAARTGSQSFVSVPLKAKDWIFGSLTVDRRDPHSLTQEDVDVMVTLASQLSIALDNASAYREIEELNIGLEHKVRERTAQLEAANNKLEELNQLKSAFVSVVSHELRTPLTSIRSFVDNMLEGMTGPLNDKQSRYLGRMVFNIDRLSRLITDLLDLSRIEAGRVELRRQSVPIAELVGDIVEGLRSLTSEKAIVLETRHACDAVSVHADRDHLTQILTNLIGNAIKFTPAGGRIEVTTQVPESGVLQVCVSDTGCGIPPEELPKVFEKFFRGSSIVRESRGAGLGLAIVKSLVELNGGAIWVESKVGAGTAFFFTLPVDEACGASKEAC
jgi:signal transduction histidine kinase